MYDEEKRKRGVVGEELSTAPQTGIGHSLKD